MHNVVAIFAATLCPLKSLEKEGSVFVALRRDKGGQVNTTKPAFLPSLKEPKILNLERHFCFANRAKPKCIKRFGKRGFRLRCTTPGQGGKQIQRSRRFGLSSRPNSLPPLFLTFFAVADLAAAGAHKFFDAADAGFFLRKAQGNFCAF